MSLLSSIQTIVTTLYPSYTFMFASQFNANRNAYDLEKTEFPLIILDNELSVDDEMQPNANLLSKERIVITIFDRDKPDSTDTESNVIVEACKTIARRIYTNIWQLDAVRLRGATLQGWRLQPVVKGWNGILSGVICNGLFVESIQTKICQIKDE